MVAGGKWESYGEGSRSDVKSAASIGAVEEMGGEFEGALARVTTIMGFGSGGVRSIGGWNERIATYSCRDA